MMIVTTETVALPRKASLPEQTAIAAIGDIHGQLDLLDKMIDHLDREVWPNITARNRMLLSLGDVTDRGPHSFGCYESLQRGARYPGVRTQVLWGNHDLMLLAVCSSDGELFSELLEEWMYWGGDAVVRELGLTLAEARTQGVLAATVGDRLGFFRSFKPYLISGDFLFIHAGVDPDRPWHDAISEPPEYFLKHNRHWAFIRSAFLKEGHNFPGIVVHGHSQGKPPEQPEVLEHRIGIDTGAFFTGRLTAMVADANDPDQVTLISVQRD